MLQIQQLREANEVFSDVNVAPHMDT